MASTLPVGLGGTGKSSIGTALQVLRVNAAGTALEFADASFGGSTNTILTTTGIPLNTTGVNGDFAYDPAATMMYGPKTSGVWPAGTLLAGPKGDKGDTGDLRYLPGETDDFYLSIKESGLNQILRYGYKYDDLGSSGVKLALIGDSQGTGFFQTTGKSIEARIKAVYPNLTVTNYCASGYNSRKLVPNGTNAYVDTAKNITKAIADGNVIIIVIDTSNDSDSTNPAGGEVPIVEWQSNLDLIDQTALNAGADIFYLSTLPRPQLGSAAQQKQKDMAGYYLKRFGNRCIYCYSAVADSTNDLNLNSLYQVGDNIHLNDAGAGIVFNILNATLLYHYSVVPSRVSLYQVFSSNAYNGIYVQYQTSAGNVLSVIKDQNYYKVRPLYVNGFLDKFNNIQRGIATGTPSTYPPTVSTGSDQVITLPTSGVTLTAIASDIDGNIISYLWTKTVGPSGSAGVGFNGGSFTPDRTRTITPDVNGKLIIDGNDGTYLPGDLVILSGSFSCITINNLQGTTSKPIVFRNATGVTTTIGNPTWAGTGESYAIEANNSRNFIFAGTDPVNFVVNGSNINTVSPGGEPWRSAYRNISMDALTENFEFCYMTVNNGGTSVVAKTDPVSGNSNTQFPNRELGQMIFHDMIISNSYNEGMYIGHTATYWDLTSNVPFYGTIGDTGSGWVSGHVYVQPILISALQIYNMLVQDAGKDGIQIAAAKNIEVARCEVKNWANVQHNAQHNGGILIGGRTQLSNIHDNITHDAWGEHYQFYGTGTGHIYRNNLCYNSAAYMTSVSNVVSGDMASLAGRTGAQVTMTGNTFARCGSSGSLVRVNGYYNQVSGANPVQLIMNSNLLAGPKNDNAASQTLYDSYYVYTENPLDASYSVIVQKGSGANANVQFGTVAASGCDVNNYYLPASAVQGFRKTNTLGPTPAGSSNAAVITSPGSATTTVTGMTIAGLYTFRCLVTDNSGLTAYDEVSVTVQTTGSNQPPTVNAGTDQVLGSGTTSVSLTAVGTDLDGTIASYAWTQVSGPNTGTITSPSSASTTVTGLIAGTYSFGCTVTDNIGATGSDTVAVTVNSATAQLGLWNFFDPTATVQVVGYQPVSGGGLNSFNYGLSWTHVASGLTLVHLVTDGTTATQKWGSVYFSNNASNNNAGAGVPDFAKDGWWNYQKPYVDQTTSSQFKVTGCQVGQTYRVRLYSSLAGSFSLDANPTRLIVNGNTGAAVDRNAIDNNLADSTKWAEITGVSPNGSGEIFIAVCPVSGSSDFAMINALQVEKL